jgi:hypothetical protein
MSVSMTEPLDGETLATDSQVVVAADAHHFTGGPPPIWLDLTRRLEVSGFISSRSGLRRRSSSIPHWRSATLSARTSLHRSSTTPPRGFLKRSRERVVFNLIFRESPRGAKKLQVHLDVARKSNCTPPLKGFQPYWRLARWAPLLRQVGKPFSLSSRRVGHLIPTAALPSPNAKGPTQANNGESAR